MTLGVSRALRAWLVLTTIGCLVIYANARIDTSDPPSDAAMTWAWATIHAQHSGEPAPAPPETATNYAPSGPIVASTFVRGRLVDHTVESGDFVGAIRRIANVPRDKKAKVVLSVVLGEGPLTMGVPILSALSVVPLREGVVARLNGRQELLPPAEMRALDLYDGAVATPLPDLTFGTRIEGAVALLARRLSTDPETLMRDGTLVRFVSTTLTQEPEASDSVVPEVLTRAATEGARFLLRHQQRDGRYTYVYDARTGKPRNDPYNMPRHAGTTYFLAQMAHMANMPEARDGAIRALQWTATRALRRCGDGDARCVESDGRVDVGSAALTAVAATELLKSGELPWVREVLTGLTAFLRSMQRPDGELMHVYDLVAHQPVDVQLLYYSGEAAFALLNAHRVTKDPRDLEAAKRLMAHLTGDGWSFFGSRYYFGEEHWTCLAVGEAADRIDVSRGAEFCERWAQFNRAVQYGADQTPWPIAGTYGVGPVLLPRLTPVASRTEAAISIYEMQRAKPQQQAALKKQIEAGLSALLRFRWAPGPSYLFFSPKAAFGGMTGSPSDTVARNDFVQHAGSAMIRWARVLRDEESGRQQSRSR